MTRLTLSGCQSLSSCSLSGKPAQALASQRALAAASSGRLRPRRLQRCLATRESEREAEAAESSSQPTRDAAGAEGATPPSNTSTSSLERQKRDVLSEDELRRLAAIKREQGKELGLLEGVLEETKLISWPSPLQAVKDTAIVVALVAATAVFLFGLNTALTELFKLFYDSIAARKS